MTRNNKYKILTVILATLYMNVSSPSSLAMETSTEEPQIALGECTKRVKSFLYELSGMNLESGLGRERGFGDRKENHALIENMVKKYEESFNNKSTEKYLALKGLDIKKLPSKVGGNPHYPTTPTSLSKLKGCIKTLDLRDNKSLDMKTVFTGLAMFASEKDFVVLIEGTPLENELKKTQIGAEDITRANASRDKALTLRISKISDCTKSLEPFLDQLIELNPQTLNTFRFIWEGLPNRSSLTDLEKAKMIKDGIIKQYLDSYAFNLKIPHSDIPQAFLQGEDLPKLSLWGLNLKKLPKEIASLKGCIRGLDLANNSDITLDSFPSDTTELDDFTVSIRGTPLEAIFKGKDKFGRDIFDVDLKKIIDEKKARVIG